MENLLMLIDMQQVKLNKQQVEFIVRKVPAVFNADTFQQELGTDKLEAIAADLEVTFEMFWKEYPNKINRKRALSVWDKLSKSNQVLAYIGLYKYKKYAEKNSKWYNVSMPETYLKDEYWTNEYAR